MYDRSALYYDALYDTIKDYEAESRELVATIERLAPGARRLLDLGCGTGRHLAQLRRRFDVAGVDASAAMVAVARERNPGVPIEVGDVRGSRLGRRFDIVTFLYGGIGYLLTPEDLAAGAATIAAHLEPGGIAIIEGWLRPDGFDPAQATGGWVVHLDDRVVSRVDRLEAVGALSILEMHYSIPTAAGIESFDETHALAMWSREDYRTAFEGADLAIEGISEQVPGRDRFILRA